MLTMELVAVAVILTVVGWYFFNTSKDEKEQPGIYC